MRLMISARLFMQAARYVAVYELPMMDAYLLIGNLVVHVKQDARS